MSLAAADLLGRFQTCLAQVGPMHRQSAGELSSVVQASVSCDHLRVARPGTLVRLELGIALRRLGSPLAFTDKRDAVARSPVVHDAQEAIEIPRHVVDAEHISNHLVVEREQRGWLYRCGFHSRPSLQAV